MILMIRALAECDSPEAAAALAPRLLQATAKWLAVEPSPPERYWKMPDLVELTFALHPAKRATFDAVVALAPEGWHHSGDASEASSVWNRAPGQVFLVPEAAWAELILTR